MIRRLLLALVGAALLVGCGAAPAITPPAPLVAPAAAPAIADPVSISIPRIGASSSLVPTGLTPDGGWEVTPVEQPEQASWFRPGPEPGEPGTAVILGHVNGGGRPGVFARLDELAERDPIEITDASGVIRLYSVTEVRAQPKKDFDAGALLRAGGPPMLLLITCGGEFDGEHYRDNLIVFAEPV